MVMINENELRLLIRECLWQFHAPFHRYYFPKSGIFLEDNTRLTSPLADSNLATTKLLTDYPSQETVSDRLCPTNGNGFRLNYHGAATIPRKGGSIDKKSFFVSANPVLDSRNDPVSYDRVVTDVTYQTEGKTNHEYAIALQRLKDLRQVLCQNRQRTYLVLVNPGLQIKDYLSGERRHGYISPMRMECPHTNPD